MADKSQPHSSLIQSLLNSYLPPDLVKRSMDSIAKLEAYKKGYTPLGTYIGPGSLSEFPGDRYGYNLGSAPGKYLDSAPKDKVYIEKDADKNIGGLYDRFSDKIKINPDSVLDPMYTLIHEAQHRRDFTDKNKNYDENDVEFQRRQNKAIKSFYESGMAGSADAIEREAVSGQMEPNEIVAQLKAYEAMLPAGMTLFQSPLGKKMFKDDDVKIWWLKRSTPKLAW